MTWVGVPAARRAMASPAAVDPTCATTRVSSCATSRSPTSPPPTTETSTPSGRASARIRPSSSPVCGQRSLGLWTTVLPITSAAPMIPAATATGSFHGVSATVTPRGRGTEKSTFGSVPSSDRPRWTGPSSEYCSSVSTPAPTPPSASPRGLPVSRSLRAASSSACSARAWAARRTAWPRWAGGIAAHAADASPDRRTAASTSSGVDASMSPTGEPSRGSVIRSVPGPASGSSGSIRPSMSSAVSVVTGLLAGSAAHGDPREDALARHPARTHFPRCSHGGADHDSRCPSSGCARNATTGSAAAPVSNTTRSLRPARSCAPGT